VISFFINLNDEKIAVICPKEEVDVFGDNLNKSTGRLHVSKPRFK
jgi:hypothetical protein